MSIIVFFMSFISDYLKRVIYSKFPSNYPYKPYFCIYNIVFMVYNTWKIVNMFYFT